MPPRRTLLMILFMTIMMGLILSAIFTWQDGGFRPGFVAAWLGRFIATYAIVLPTVVVVSPIAQWAAGWLDQALSAQTPSGGRKGNDPK